VVSKRHGRAGLQSDTGIRDIEQGRRLPGWEMVVALCQALGVSCDAFMQKPTGKHQLRPGRPRKAAATAKATARGRKRK